MPRLNQDVEHGMTNDLLGFWYHHSDARWERSCSTPDRAEACLTKTVGLTWRSGRSMKEGTHHEISRPCRPLPRQGY